MPDPIGYAFAPGADQGMSGQAGSARPYGRDEALQILSLLLPKVPAPNQPIPQELLTAPGTQGGADPGVELLKKILEAIGQPGGPAGPAAGGSPPRPQPRAGAPPSPFAGPSTLQSPSMPGAGGAAPPRIVPGGQPVPQPPPVMQPPTLPKAPFDGPQQGDQPPGLRRPLLQLPF
jgi:hypothetical protein